MKWIRGGTWVAEPVKERSATAYKAYLQPAIARGDLKARLATQIAGGSFLSTPDEWARVVGEPANLEDYEPTPTDALSALRRMQRLSDTFRSELERQPLEEMLPQRRNRLISSLVEVVSAFGPLAAVKGVLEVGAGVDEGEFRCIDLDALAQEVFVFGLAFEEVESSPRDEARRQLASWMQETSKKDLREVRVVVEVTTDYGVRFEARPTTLRAFLWEVLFGRNDRFPGICRYCGDEFELPPGRGRPYRFCPAHRSPRCRTAVFEGRQPYKGNIRDVE